MIGIKKKHRDTLRLAIGHKCQMTYELKFEIEGMSRGWRLGMGDKN